MHRALLACILGFAFLGDARADEPIIVAGQTSWEGEYYLKLRAAWGKPSKTKRHGKVGKLLVYRLRLYGNDVVGAGSIRLSDAGIGPSDPNDGNTVSGGDIKFSGTLEVLATQKVKFYVNDQGIIYEQEFSPVKWKKKR